MIKKLSVNLIPADPFPPLSVKTLLKGTTEKYSDVLGRGFKPLPGWFEELFLLLEPYNPSKSARKSAPEYPFECGGV